MRRAARLSLILVLLALPAVTAYAQGNANNLEPCWTYTNATTCTLGCTTNSPIYDTCPCFWDDPTTPDGFPIDQTNGIASDCSEAHPCCWNRPCTTFASLSDCAIGGGGDEGPPPDFVITEGNCHWYPNDEAPNGGRCGCVPPQVDIPVPANENEIRFAPFDCDCPYLTHAEWSAQGGQGPCGPPPLDHFTFYKTKTSAGATKFVRFGSILLSDAFQTNAPYQVTKPVKLGLPSNKNAEGVSDADTHREEYLVKPVKGGPEFAKRAAHVVNQCNDLVLDVAKPVSLLVPTAKSLTDPVVAPDLLHHNLEHFLCYQAKAQTKFPKGIQVDVADQFQTRRYDLVKITKVCNAVDKAGTPTLLSGPSKGDAKPITPAVRTTPDQHLVCYQAKLAAKLIAQTGCGPTSASDKGTPIVPAQAKHAPVAGLFVANQFGAGRLDADKVAEFCIPSSVD